MPSQGRWPSSGTPQAEYEANYNGRRPHRSRQIRPLRPDESVADISQERIKHRPLLGGIYERIPASHTEAQFKASGRVLAPHRLDPASITALIVAKVMLGLFYANSTYVSMLLRNRLDDGSLKPTDALPAETHEPIADAHKQFIAGLIGMVVATGFFVAFLWT